MEPEEDEREEVQEDVDLGFSEDEEEDTYPEPEPEPDPTPQAEDEAPEPVSAYVPEAGEDADDAALRELMSPDAYASMRRVMQREMRQQMQAMTAANIHVTTAAAQAPELFNAYGPRIQHNLAQMDPSVRSKPEAINIAIAGVFLEEARTKGAAAALAKMAALTGTTPAVPKVPKAPIPAAQRPPSPSTGGRTQHRERPTVDQSRMKALMSYGLSEAEARIAMSDEGVLR